MLLSQHSASLDNLWTLPRPQRCKQSQPIETARTKYEMTVSALNVCNHRFPPQIGHLLNWFSDINLKWNLTARMVRCWAINRWYSHHIILLCAPYIAHFVFNDMIIINSSEQLTLQAPLKLGGNETKTLKNVFEYKTLQTTKHKLNKHKDFWLPDTSNGCFSRYFCRYESILLSDAKMLKYRAFRVFCRAKGEWTIFNRLKMTFDLSLSI